MNRYLMDKTENVVKTRKTSIVTADQPLLVMDIQWEWPDLYREDKFIVM